MTGPDPAAAPDPVLDLVRLTPDELLAALSWLSGFAPDATARAVEHARRVTTAGVSR